jgi:very-short-patch-repair endonuclease/Zn finger protein HypA/HybF involved in hydrogenase expression
MSRLTNEEFQKKLNKVQSNLKLIGDYHNAHTKVKYICTNCNSEGVAEANSLMRGLSGCGVCGKGRKLVIGKNDFYTLYPTIAEKYFVDIEDAKHITKASAKKINMKCPICGNIREYEVTSLMRRGFKCPKCGDGYSYPNKFMYVLLKYLDLKFDREKEFEWSDNKIYDFIVDKNIIEMDGAFHDNEDSIKNDQYKNKLAKDNGYNLYRVDCRQSEFEYIKNNVIKTLSDVLDLKRVDWLKVQSELVNFNYVQVAVDCFNKNLGKLSMAEMAKSIDITSAKFCSMLKIGAKFGLCNYNPIKSRSGEYTPKDKKHNSSKKVICIEDHHTFNSAKEAEIYYGFSKDSVARVCRKERNSTHGLHFNYI